jgi:TRAP-type mannitol/chloroaromatic compound transport system permease large subunit
MQLSFLRPPFGCALFYIRGVAPPHIKMTTIFKAALAFLAMQCFGLTICLLFPAIITFFTQLIYG